MPVLRNILIGLNVVAALAFFILAALDWGARTQWAHTVFRYELALNGLPVDDTERDLHGDLIVRKIPGEPVKTQKEALDAAITKLQSDINSQPDDAAKKKRLLEVLGSLVYTQAERDRLAKLDVPQLEQALNDALRPAQDGRGPQGELSLHQRRMAIAHVLVALSGHEPADQTRLLTVLGAEAYAHAAEQQAANMQEMAQRVRHQTALDLHAFEVQHKELIYRILLLAERVADLKATLQYHKALTEKHQVLVNARKADVKDLETRLATASVELDKALAEQAKLEQERFETERLLGQTKEKNQEMEREIRSRELGR
jgi:hypothetical protein